ncbi:Magnesium transporter NIPA [Clostridium acidisoli DSM 12555]|uniref:Magnesium transporter NIPA n=1 Tax=Clostridium acidisoli DSM 12555 TaxID=1121291 RepID=A0A1W1XAW0_9CLOT|nr:DMT family transporter [Clostridium acidisoli]SMC20997.1 Magnesium transporter NIPA [Clostridium acidisoli DSM 12555]
MNKLILILIIIIMTLLGSFGGFFFKKSTAGDGVLAIIKSKFLYMGGVLYILSALLNIVVLKYMPLSVVLPMTAITYIWSMISSKVMLKEKITKYKLFGMFFIIIGVVFIGLS